MAVTAFPAASSSSLFIHLLGGPWITIDSISHEVPDGSKRLLAFLALDRRRLDRHYVAGALWPDRDDDRAAGCLRTALWRLRHVGLDVVEVSHMTLRLVPEVRVDAEEARDWAVRILAGQPGESDLRPCWDRTHALDLLPGWYDNWVTNHREWLRQLVLHALDEASRQLTARGRPGDAVTIAQRTVDADPLRESAQQVLLEAHVAEGNLAEARRVLARYESHAHAELGIRPGPHLYTLVGREPPALSAG